MEWKYYNLMTKEDKEEYDYKFEDYNIGSSLFSILYSSLLFLALCIFFIMAIALVLYIPSMSIYENQIVIWIDAVSKIMLIWQIIIVAIAIIDILSFFFQLLEESKWLGRKGYKVKFAELDFERRKERINK